MARPGAPGAPGTLATIAPWALGLLVLLTRLPFLGHGPGVDADADRIVLAARSIAGGGGYSVSRVPGYPLVEFAGAALVSAGAPDLDLAAAVLSALCAVLLFLLLREAAVRWAALGVLAFAAAPIVFIHSTTSMDYIWALTAFLGSLLAARRGRPFLAGVLLGIATGCRITSLGLLPAAGLAVPFSSAAVSGTGLRERLRSCVLVACTAIPVAALSYLPVFARYGPSFLAHSGSQQVPFSRLVYKSTVLVWGWPGLLALLLALGYLAWRFARGAVRDTWGRGDDPEPLTAAALAGALWLVVLFLKLPLEAGYLIPLVPLVVLLVGIVLPSPAFVAVCLSVCLSPLLTLSTDSARPVPGPIFQDVAARDTLRTQATALLDFGRGRPQPSLLVVGAKDLPRLKALEPEPSLELDPTGTPAANRTALLAGRSRFVSRLDPPGLEQAVSSGQEVYYVDEIAEENLNEAGLDLKTSGARPIRWDGSPAQAAETRP